MALYCAYCGKELPDDAAFCHKCGKAVPQDSSPSQKETANNVPQSALVLARCTKTRQPLGMRFEEKSAGQWFLVSAFPLGQDAAERGGYGPAELPGAFFYDETYAGCPYCQAKSFFRSICGKMACWDGSPSPVTCPWCDHIGTISGSITTLTRVSDF